ncbi:diguanylate cyclase [Xanthobacteraceae bacterium A53D]
MSFDLTTVTFMALTIGTLMGMVQFVAWLQMRSELPFALWGIADLLCVSGAALAIINGNYRSPVLAPLASSIMLLGLAAIYLGMRAFDRQTLSTSGVALAVAAAAGFYGVSVLFLQHDVQMRIVLFSFIAAAWLIAAAWRLVRMRRKISTFARLLTAAFLMVLGVFQMLRLFTAWFGPEAGAVHVSPGELALAIGFGLFCVVGLNTGAIFMVLDRLASCDDLTGLINRRALLRTGERIFGRAAARGRPLTVMLADLDHFKSINDRFGHRTGDRVLQQFALIARDMSHAGDLVARYGGEEFCIVLRGRGPEEAMVLAERLRAAVAHDLATVAGVPMNVTVTIGLAGLERGVAPPTSMGALIDAADHALYAAKEAGRNRVMRARPASEEMNVVPMLGALARRPA